MPEPQVQSDDPRAELERLRKLKRLKELEAKAGGSPPSDVNVPYASFAGSKPIDIMGWDASSLDDPNRIFDVVIEQFKRQRALQGDFERQILDERANEAGTAARQEARRGSMSNPGAYALSGMSGWNAGTEAAGKVYNAEGVASPDQAAATSYLNASLLGIPAAVNPDIREALKMSFETQPGPALAGEIGGSVAPGELAYQGGRAAYNATLKPVINRLMPSGINALSQTVRFGTHLGEQAGAWAGQNALYQATTGASRDAALEGRAPTLEDMASGAQAGATDPFNLLGPGFVFGNRALRYARTGGVTATPADRFAYAQDLAGGVPTVLTPSKIPQGAQGKQNPNYTSAASQPEWWQNAYQRVQIMLENSGVPKQRIKQGLDNIAASMAQNADSRTPIAMMLEREFADLGPQVRENIRTFLLKGDLDKLPAVGEFVETSTNRSAQDYRDLIDQNISAEPAAPAQEAIAKSLEARGNDYDKVLEAGKANIPNDAPLVVSMQQHLLTQTDGPMKATRVLAQEAKDRGWKDAETFIMQDPWNAAHQYRIRVAKAMRASGDKAVELQPDIEFIDDFLGHLPGYNTVKQNYAKEAGVRDALGWVDPDTGKVTPSFGQELKKAARSERETEYAAKRYEGMDPRQQQAARISTAETLRDATRGVRPQGTDQFGNDVLGLRLSMLPTEGFSSHALPRTFGEAGESVSRGIDDIVNRRQFVADISSRTGSNTVNKALAHQTGDDVLIQGLSRDATRNTANNPGRAIDIAMLANGLPPVLWFAKNGPAWFRKLITPGRTTRNDIAKILLAIPPSQREEVLRNAPMKPLSGRNSPKSWRRAYENDGEGLPGVLKSPGKPPSDGGTPPIAAAGFAHIPPPVTGALAGGTAGGAVGYNLPADSEEDRRFNAAALAFTGAGLGGAAGGIRGHLNEPKFRVKNAKDAIRRAETPQAFWDNVRTIPEGPRRDGVMREMMQRAQSAEERSIVLDKFMGAASDWTQRERIARQFLRDHPLEWEILYNVWPSNPMDPVTRTIDGVPSLMEMVSDEAPEIAKKVMTSRSAEEKAWSGLLNTAQEMDNRWSPRLATDNGAPVPQPERPQAPTADIVPFRKPEPPKMSGINALAGPAGGAFTGGVMPLPSTGDPEQDRNNRLMAIAGGALAGSRTGRRAIQDVAQGGITSLRGSSRIPSGGYDKFQIGKASVEVTRMGDQMTINRINVPQDARGGGEASKALKEILRQADEEGVTVFLTADPVGSGGLSRRQLEAFYGRHGFAPNRGANKDFSNQAGMVRRPMSGASIGGRPPKLPKIRQDVMNKAGTGPTGSRRLGRGLDEIMADQQPPRAPRPQNALSEPPAPPPQGSPANALATPSRGSGLSGALKVGLPVAGGAAALYGLSHMASGGQDAPRPAAVENEPQNLQDMRSQLIRHQAKLISDGIDTEFTAGAVERLDALISYEAGMAARQPGPPELENQRAELVLRIGRNLSDPRAGYFRPDTDRMFEQLKQLDALIAQNPAQPGPPSMKPLPVSP